LGYRFEQLAQLLSMTNNPARTGVCIDTCHIFAAGYDLRSETAYYQTMEKLNRIIGFQQIYLFHLNDSKRNLGSRVDRHERIGEGEIGIPAFRLLMNDKCFRGIPGILEIPGGESAFRENIEKLKSFRSQISG